MNPLTPLAFTVLALALSGCNKPQARKPPVPFEITALEIVRDPEFTNFISVVGAVSIRGDALKGKAVILLLNAKLSFKRSGITHSNLIVPVVVTNGLGILKAGSVFSRKEQETIGPEFSSPTYSFEAVGFHELESASVEIR